MTGGAATPTVNLRRERISRGWSQRRAAAEIGISPTSLRRAEQRERVELAVAHAIVTKYGLNLFEAFPEFEEEAAA